MNLLVPATVLPVVFSRLSDAPHDMAPGPPLTAVATILVISGISLKAGATLRLWAPLAGVIAGSAIGGSLGLYDFDLVARAPWVGLPQGSWPGIGLDLGPAFAGLLPAFVFVSLIGAIQTITGAVAIQRVSWRRPRAVDYRAVEGAVAADGIGKLLSGLAAIVPTQTIAVSAPTIELTGVAARRVGIAAGGVLVALAFLPKVLAMILAIPSPVIVAYLTVVLAMTFVRGMTEVVQGGIDHRKGMICGVAFWVGVGCQNDLLFPGLLSELGGGLLKNGITAGGIVAILMTLFLEATAPRRSRIEGELDLSMLPKIREVLAAFASRSGWGATMVDRLDAATEETLLTLIGEDEDHEKRERRRLLLQARKEADGAVPRVRRSLRRGEPSEQDRPAHRDPGRSADGAGGLAAAVAAHRLLRSPSAVPRHGDRDRPREGPGDRPWEEPGEGVVRSEAEDAGPREETAKPVAWLNHEEEFERAWTGPGNTRIELSPVDVNLVLARHYRTSEPLRFTRTMLWDMEVKKAFRPDLYIPSVVSEGSSSCWRRRAEAGGAESFVRCSRQRLWLQPSEHGLVLEQVFLNPERQSATFIGAAELFDGDGNLLRAGEGQPLFHVEHSVDGGEFQPRNLWRIVYLTDRPEQKLIERFTLAKDVWLREFVEIYIRRDLKIELARRES